MASVSTQVHNCSQISRGYINVYVLQGATQVHTQFNTRARLQCNLIMCDLTTVRLAQCIVEELA